MINLSKGKTLSLSKAMLTGEVKVTMSWETSIDLDLHCIADGEHIYFGHKRGRYATLDKDAGVGNRGGRNKETLRLKEFSEVKNALFYVKNYGGNEPFGKYKARLNLEFVGNPTEIDMNDGAKGRYFAIAAIRNGQLVSINKTVDHEPRMAKVDEYLGLPSVPYVPVATATKGRVDSLIESGGIFGKVKGFFGR